jgi:hypothetical protein
MVAQNSRRMAAVLGLDHPDTLRSRNNPANARQVAGGANEADDQDP